MLPPSENHVIGINLRFFDQFHKLIGFVAYKFKVFFRSLLNLLFRVFQSFLLRNNIFPFTENSRNPTFLFSPLDAQIALELGIQTMEGFVILIIVLFHHMVQVLICWAFDKERNLTSIFELNRTNLSIPIFKCPNASFLGKNFK